MSLPPRNREIDLLPPPRSVSERCQLRSNRNQSIPTSVLIGVLVLFMEEILVLAFQAIGYMYGLPWAGVPEQLAE